MNASMNAGSQVTFGEYSRAATFFTKAIDMCPDVVEFSFQRAEILGRLEVLNIFTTCG